MALVKCRECGGTVSSFAKICPHCGHEMEDVEIAPKVTNQPESQPEMTYQPIDSPSYNPQQTQHLPSMNRSTGMMGKVLMCLLSIISIILLGVVVSKGKAGEPLSPEFGKVFLGYYLSFIVLFFFSQTKEFNKILPQFLSFVIGAAVLFMEIVLFTHIHTEMSDDMSKAFFITLLLSLLLITWFAGTKNNWSKYFFLVPGVLMLSAFSLKIGSFSATMNIILAVLGGIGLFSMLVGWFVEMKLQGNNSTTRLIALIEVALILITVIIGAITLKTILDTGADVTERFNKMKMTTICLIISGASSTFLSLLLPRKKFLFYMSALMLCASLFLTLGHYYDFCLNVQDYADYQSYCHNRYVYPSNVDATIGYFSKHAYNMFLTACFFIPISILMSYVAEMTKGITSKLSFKIQ